jgi:hypothetical protein
MMITSSTALSVRRMRVGSQGPLAVEDEADALVCCAGNSDDLILVVLSPYNDSGVQALLYATIRLLTIGRKR